MWRSRGVGYCQEVLVSWRCCSCFVELLWRWTLRCRLCLLEVNCKTQQALTESVCRRCHSDAPCSCPQLGGGCPPDAPVSQRGQRHTHGHSDTHLVLAHSLAAGVHPGAPTSRRRQRHTHTGSARLPLRPLLNSWPRYKALPSPVWLGLCHGSPRVHFSEATMAAVREEFPLSTVGFVERGTTSICKPLDRSCFRSVTARTVQNFSSDLAVQMLASSNPAGVLLSRLGLRADLPLRTHASVAEAHTAERNEAAWRHFWVGGAARCDVLAEASTVHPAGILFSLPPREADLQQSDTTGFAREDPQEDGVDDHLQQKTKQNELKTNPAPTPQHHVQAFPFVTSPTASHSSWCTAHRRSVICGAWPVNLRSCCVASMRGSRMGSEKRRQHLLPINALEKG